MIPYTFRIMACLPGHDPVELFRTRHKYEQSYWTSWTRDLSPEWTCWVEHRLDDRFTITPRIQIYNPASREYRLPFTREEKAALRCGLELEFNP